jgi:cullin 1
MDESLLHYYTKQWKKFTVASSYVHHVFSYLNRHWVKREIEEGRKNDVFEVYTVSDQHYKCGFDLTAILISFEACIG